ncbi:MAG: hypothetical protein EXR77_04945 [Myxococcales bacterium]|nr:hypothetical protein [Myxococcales bacterium]
MPTHSCAESGESRPAEAVAHPPHLRYQRRRRHSLAGPKFSEQLRTRPEVDHSIAVAPPRVGRWLALSVVVGCLSAWFAVAEPAGRASHATFDLERDLQLAQVSVVRGDRATPCTWTDDHRFSCDAQPWAFVGPYGSHTAGKARRCIWIHPLAGGAPTELVWPKQPLGARLVASIGLVDDAGPGSPVEMTIASGATVLATLRSSDSRELDTKEAKLPPGPAIAPLRIQVRTPDHTLRMACIDVRMYGERTPTEAIDTGRAR